MILQRGSQLVYYALLKGGAGIHSIRGWYTWTACFYWLKSGIFFFFNEFSETKWYVGEDEVFLGVLWSNFSPWRPLPPLWISSSLKEVRAPCYCASLLRTLCMTWRVLRYVYQARTPSWNSTKYRADELCGNLISKYFCWMLGDPHFFSADHFLFSFFPLY